MKQKYNVRITENIADKLSVKQAYFYYCLLLCTDYKTLISHAKQEKLAEFYGIKKVDQIRGYLKYFEEVGLIRIEKEKINSANYTFERNIYHLTDEHFVMISNELYSLDISKDLKGFLILFKCLCLNGTNLCMYSIREMEKHLKLSARTIQKYLQQAINEKYIKRTDKGYVLTNKELFIITSESDFAILQNVYPEILTAEDIANRKIIA